MAEIMTELRRGTFRLLKPIFFKEFSERWLKDYAVLSVKPLTLRFYRTMVRSYLNPALGNLLLSQITPHRIQSLLASYQRERHLSAKTLRCLLTTLKTMLKHAKQWNHLRENPAEGVKPPRLEEREMDFLHPGEIQLLLKHSDEPHRTLFLTAILTGMRRGELLGLQWGDIDWHNNLIHVRRSLYWQTQEELAEHNDTRMGKWRFSTPKSKNSVRRSVMSPKLREALELHQIASPRSQYDLVFCTKDGQPIHAENMLRREFFPALRRAGLRRIRFHDLRHTYTTLLIAQGENVKFIQSQLGHASIETTLDRYGHLLPEAHGQVGERLDALVFECDNG
ncbi:MAG: site-specific integrase, partial [Candidatus Omnitrophica bacterium]|nr:site-specific integrase [Candidatus Omnitrophota bacterium]